jgi:hypothetical protein
MESYGFFIINRECLIGRIYERVLRVSLMFYYDEVKDALINLGEPRWRFVSGTFYLDF